MKTITACLEKGGSAKTTTNNALGAGLARKGFSVLYVDLDPQANLTQTVLASPSSLSTYEVLAGDASADEAIETISDKIAILPASRRNSKVDRVLGDEQGREYRLKEALEPIQSRYDYCLIDTPPSLNLLTINALTATDSVVIPCQTDVYALEAISNLYTTIQSVRKYSNPDLVIEGILLTRYNPRTNLSKLATEKANELAKAIGTRLFKAKIREAIAIREAQLVKQDIFTYAPKSKVAGDYLAFIDELLEDME